MFHHSKKFQAKKGTLISDGKKSLVQNANQVKVTISAQRISPEVSGLVGVRGPELGDEDAEDVDEEDKVGEDAEEPRRHVDPLHPLLALGGQRPTERIVHKDPEDAVEHAGNHGQAWKKENGDKFFNMVLASLSVL